MESKKLFGDDEALESIPSSPSQASDKYEFDPVEIKPSENVFDVKYLSDDNDDMNSSDAEFINDGNISEATWTSEEQASTRFL